MTTEDDFQKVLDANPEDWQTRLVFADWLDERGDPRADGYRAIAVLRLRPNPRSPYWSNERDKSWSHHATFNLLPEDWFALTTPSTTAQSVHCTFGSRHEAENAAALSFARLPDERRAELLAAQSA